MSFTTIGTASNDKILLGTDRGTVCVYHMASLQFINEIPYQLGLRSNFQLNGGLEKTFKSINLNFIILGLKPLLSAEEDQDLEQAQEQFSLFKVGPPVSFVGTTYNLRYLMIKYADASFVMIDRSVQNPGQAIIGHHFGHFQAVSGLQWVSGSAISKKGEDTFVTCSHDMSVFVWRQFGDRWAFSFIDVVKCFDAALACNRKDKATRGLKLTALRAYPKQPLLAVGDSKGVLRIFQVSQERAVLLSTNELNKGTDVIAREDGIVDILLTADE